MDSTEPKKNIRVYTISECCIFRDNAGEFGGLSNMSSAFPLQINHVRIKTLEALYQACKFPEDIELQKRIIAEPSPFTAKMITKGKATRKDWMDIRVEVMRWCLQIKLAQNYNSFGLLLSMTERKNIVEYSRRDDFWGAKQINDKQLQGINALGRLVMELRQFYLSCPKSELVIVKKPAIRNFSLFGEEINDVDMTAKYQK
ncbi:NADAR family protein [Flammeovirgaceae bacterium]